MTADEKLPSASWLGRCRAALVDRLELSRGGTGHNVRPMEGLRGFAVFLVFLVHYISLSLPWVPVDSVQAQWAHGLHAMGNVGVDLFFVLSGYLIYGSLVAKRQAYGAFIWRRVVRIYPTFLVVFALYLALSLLFPAESKLPEGGLEVAWYLLANLLLLPGLAPIEPMITVAWSLSYEFAYYLVTPFVVLLLGLHQRTPVWRLVCFGLAGVLALVGFGIWGGPVRLAMFVAGIVLYECLLIAPRTRGRSAWGGLALVAALALAAWPAAGHAGLALKLGLLGVLFLVVCHSAFTDATGRLAQALSWTPLRWLGNISYSYYLIHGLALKGMFMVVAKWWPPAPEPGVFLWLPLAFVLSCVPSLALFLLIERPWSLAPQPRKARAALPA